MEFSSVTPIKFPKYAQELSFGASWACWQTASSHGILKDLREVMGDEGESLLKIAIYWYLTGGSMDGFADWQRETWLPPSKLLTGYRISELLAKVDKSLMAKYFKLRLKRNLESDSNRGNSCELNTPKPSNKGETPVTNKASNIAKPSTDPGLPPPKRYLALDLTSISNYSESISETMYGYEKQNSELRKVNVTVVMDFFSGDLVCAHVSNGSISDKGHFGSILTELKAAGFDLNRIVLVTSRGYVNLQNIQSLISSELSYISRVPITEKSIQDRFIKHELSFDDPASWLEGIPMAARTFEEDFKHSTDLGSISIKGWLHLYKKPGKGEFDLANFTAKLDKFIERKNSGEKISPDEWRQYASFVIEKDGVFERNLNKIKKQIALDGTLALRTNCVSGAKTCLIACRERNQLENAFWHLEVGNNNDRLHTMEPISLGEIFMFIIAQSIRFVHSTNARRNQTGNLKISGENLDCVMGVLNKVEVRRDRTGGNWILQPVSKKAMDCLALLGIEEKLPRRVSMV